MSELDLKTIPDELTLDDIARMPKDEAAFLSELKIPDDISRDIGFPGPNLSDFASAAPHIIDVKPTGYHLLIEIPPRADRTVTGIYRPEEYRLREQVASVVALVIEVGPEAYRDRDRFPTGTPWCQAGDFILIHPYTGSRFQFKEGDTSREYRILEDRHVLAVVSRQALCQVDRINAV